MSKHLNEIIQLPLDLSCLNVEIVKLVAATLSIPQIDLLNDPTDKIVSRMYRFHLESFIKNKENIDGQRYCIFWLQRVAT